MSSDLRFTKLDAMRRSSLEPVKGQEPSGSRRGMEGSGKWPLFPRGLHKRKILLFEEVK